jgi:hypothetical protein
MNLVISWDIKVERGCNGCLTWCQGAQGGRLKKREVNRVIERELTFWLLMGDSKIKGPRGVIEEVRTEGSK